MRHGIICTYFLIIAANSLYGQTVLAEFNIPKGIRHEPKQIQCIAVGDSLLISYQIPLATKGYEEFNVHLACTDGKNKRMNITAIHDKILCGAVDAGEGKLLYFLELAKKDVVVKGVKLDFHGDTLLTEHLSLSGKFIGSDIRNNVLFIYLFEKKSLGLKIFQIEGLQIKDESEYKLPIDISKFKSTDVSLISEGTHIGTAQAGAKIKIVLQGENIAISVDEPFNEYDKLPKPIRTVVISINSETKKMETKIFPEESKYVFRSIISNDLLFRTVNTHNEVKLQIYELRRGSRVHRKIIPNDAAAEKIDVVFKEGRVNHFSGETKLSNMIFDSGMCLPLVTVNKTDDNDFIIVWGTYYENNTLLAGLPNPFLSMMISVLGTAILELKEGPGDTRHFYLKGNVNSGFDIITETSGSDARLKIDRYEMELNKNQVLYRRKGYHQLDNGLLAFYYLPKLDKLQMLLFE